MRVEILDLLFASAHFRSLNNKNNNKKQQVGIMVRRMYGKGFCRSVEKSAQGASFVLKIFRAGCIYILYTLFFNRPSPPPAYAHPVRPLYCDRTSGKGAHHRGQQANRSPPGTADQPFDTENSRPTIRHREQQANHSPPRTAGQRFTAEDGRLPASERQKNRHPARKENVSRWKI